MTSKSLAQLHVIPAPVGWRKVCWEIQHRDSEKPPNRGVPAVYPVIAFILHPDEENSQQAELVISSIAGFSATYVDITDGFAIDEDDERLLGYLAPGQVYHEDEWAERAQSQYEQHEERAHRLRKQTGGL